ASAPHHHLDPFPTRRSSDLQPVPATAAVRGLQRLQLGDLPAAQYRLHQPELRHDRRPQGHDLLPAERADWREVLVLSLAPTRGQDRKSTRLNSSHVSISYAV